MSITITHQDQLIELKWTNLSDFKQYAAAQSNGKHGWDNYDIDPKYTLANIEAKLSRLCAKKLPLIHLNELPESARIVDIGSGIGMIDLLISKILPSADFYLIDKSELDLNIPSRWFSIDHPFYNSFNVTEDGIMSSGIDRTKFNLISPTDPFPEKVDIIMSHISWCWHYPKEVYWNKVVDNLKIGGILLLDIFNGPSQSAESVISEISEEFNCVPQLIEIIDTNRYRGAHSFAPLTSTNILGYHASFKRNI